jgi:hypothetical protein
VRAGPAHPPPRGAAGMRLPRSPRPAPRRTAGTRAVANRRVTIARRQPPKSTANRLLGRLAGMLPGAGARKRGRRAPRGAKATAPAGLALLAGAAGMALKNRNKLTGLLPGRSRQEQSPPTPPAVETAPVERVPESPTPHAPPPPAARPDAADAPAHSGRPPSPPPGNTSP